MEEGGGSAYGNEKEKTFVLIYEFSSANRAVNAGQDFSVKFHQWVHGTFDFFISDLDKFTLKTKTKKIIQIIEGFDGVLKSTLKLPFNQKKKTIWQTDWQTNWLIDFRKPSSPSKSWNKIKRPVFGSASSGKTYAVPTQ